MRRLFFYRQFVTDPEVIIAVNVSPVRISTTTLKGTHVRVSPKNAREVMALQFLEHRRDKFAPASGNGIILTIEGLEKIS